MQTIATKPTKAMTDWLLWISKGGVIERTSVSDPVAIRSAKRIGWEMLDKLEAAGFIVKTTKRIKWKRIASCI